MWAIFYEFRRTNLIKSVPSGTFTKHHPQEGLHTQRASFSKRLASRRSSPILPSESACACSSSRTARRSLLSFPCVLLSSLCGGKPELTRQNDGCLNFVDENDEVLISGFGRRGKAKGDIPGVRFKVVKVSGVGLLALWKEKKVRMFQSLHSDSATQPLVWPVGEAPLIIRNLCYSAGSSMLWFMPSLYCNSMHFRMKLETQAHTSSIIFSISSDDIEQEPKWVMHVELSRHDKELEVYA